ncbi:ribonuclease H-like protein [Xylariaceae sp. FL0255]|nr:ribonuclease H-like protein [Xylariaceae sp. FL0255]
MTATPPPQNPRLWHPSRGISFSPALAAPSVGAQSSRTVVELPLRVGRPHAIPPQSLATAQGAVSLTEKTRQQPDAIRTVASTTGNNDEQALAIPDGEDVSNEPVERTDGDREAVMPEKKASDDPPPPCFEYKIQDDLFRAAKNATPGTSESFWSFTQYRRTAEDGSLETVKVHYCRSKQKMEEVCQKYFMNEKLLGFDLEWVPESSKRDGVKRNVSLIQIASPSRIALFHVALFANMGNLVAPSFKAIMENPEVTKIGVAIKGDATRLRNFLFIDSRGLMELSHLYKLVTYSSNKQYKLINKKLVTLAAQVEEYLHLPLFKGQGVRSSDWSRPLDMDQILYSASDAYASLHLYATLEHHRKQLDPCPPTPHHAELNIPIRLADGVDIDDVPDEALEIELEKTSEALPKPSTEYMASALESVTIEDQDTTALGSTKWTPPSDSKRTPSPPVEHSPDDSRMEIVRDLAAAYRSLHPHSRAKAAQLRAYYLWHRYDLAPQYIRKMMRDPPVAFTTVVHYILTVLQSEDGKLPVDMDRLQQLTQLVGVHMLWSRWPVIAKKVSDYNSTMGGAVWDSKSGSAANSGWEI